MKIEITLFADITENQHRTLVQLFHTQEHDLQVHTTGLFPTEVFRGWLIKISEQKNDVYDRRNRRLDANQPRT